MAIFQLQRTDNNIINNPTSPEPKVTGWPRLLCPVNPSSKCPWSAARSARMTWLDSTSTPCVLSILCHVFAMPTFPIFFLKNNKLNVDSLAYVKKCDKKWKYVKIRWRSKLLNMSQMESLVIPGIPRPRQLRLVRQTQASRWPKNRADSWHLLTAWPSNVSNFDHDRLRWNTCKSMQNL